MRTGGGTGRSSRTGSKEGVSGLLDLTARLVDVLRWCKGVGMTGAAPAASKFTGGATHRRRRPGGISACAGSEVGDGGLGVDPGPEAELLRCLAGPGGGEAATPRRRRASKRRSGWWRLRDGEVQGRHGVVPIYRAVDHPRRARPGEESRRDSRPKVALRGGDDGLTGGVDGSAGCRGRGRRARGRGRGRPTSGVQLAGGRGDIGAGQACQPEGAQVWAWVCAAG